MQMTQLNQMLREELDRIPRGDLTQNELRMVYNIERRHDLGLNPLTPRIASLQAAINSVRGRHAAFVPSYDRAFFGA